MRHFELFDGEGERRCVEACADIWYDPASECFSATVRGWAGPADVPAIFARFVEQGEREIPSEWVRAWVDERIAPPGRQNIGQILRANHLDRYDPCALLAAGAGRSSQDGFYIREVGTPFTLGIKLGDAVAQARAAAGLTQEQLAERTGIRQETISRIESGGGNPTAKTLERIARATGKRLQITLVD